MQLLGEASEDGGRRLGIGKTAMRGLDGEPEDKLADIGLTLGLSREAIRQIVTSLIQRRDDNKAKGLPNSNLYHMISNVRITFPRPGEALHQSYWQTVYRDKDSKMTAAAMGRSEDRLVKRNGKWLIQERKLTVFTD